MVCQPLGYGDCSLKLIIAGDIVAFKKMFKGLKFTLCFILIGTTETHLGVSRRKARGSKSIISGFSRF